MKKQARRWFDAATLAGAPALFLLGAPFARAQSPESDVPPDAEEHVRDSDAYAIPDVGDEVLKSMQAGDEHERFSMKIGLAVLLDYTTFEQDPASKEQVGRQDDSFEARSGRLIMRGHFELWRDWNYMFSGEYKGFDQTSESNWNYTDARISTDLGPRWGRLTLGKQKEPFVYEMVGDAANLPQNERLLSPFFRSRNVGVQLSNTVFDQRGTWALGWYNDWWLEGRSFSDSGNDFVGRLTALPVWSDDGLGFVHLAASVRYTGGVDNQVRFRGRPASNVADYYVDTGNLPADHAWNTGLEALVSVRGWSLLAEYVRANLSTRNGDDPVFSGYYLTGSWVITGENRPYDRKAGYARRILPEGRWGAWEVIGRYGSVDLNSDSIRGGRMPGWWTGVNWWATRRYKFSVGYGNIDLERFGATGNTQTFLARAQWIY